jgi:hypothetical protein
LVNYDKRIKDVPEAKNVVVRIILNRDQKPFLLSHRDYAAISGIESPKEKYPYNLTPEQNKVFEEQRREGEKRILESVARRAKYEFFMWRVVAEKYVGTMPKETVWDGSSPAWDTDYVVVETIPKGEVQVTPKTLMTCELK